MTALLRRGWKARPAIAALFLVAACCVLSDCTTLDRDAHADALAAPVQLHREPVRTDAFVLTAFARITRADQPLTVYIEGDGLAWVSRTEPSADPTPRKATGLALAAADPAPNVVYLARPCQFTPMAQNPRCAAPYWTSKRFAPEVVASMSEAVSRFAAKVPGQPIHLVGYSGGGAVAVLVAAQRRGHRLHSHRGGQSGYGIRQPPARRFTDAGIAESDRRRSPRGSGPAVAFQRCGRHRGAAGSGAAFCARIGWRMRAHRHRTGSRTRRRLGRAMARAADTRTHLHNTHRGMTCNSFHPRFG